MKYVHSLALLGVLLFISCKKEVTANQSDQRQVVPFTQQTTTGIQSQAPVAPNQNHNLFHENNAASTPSLVSGINPAHGQPNHRCDIAVGAPLNSLANGAAPAQVANVQPSQQIVTTTQPTSVKTITAKGMNPPHGEKNHRCDIAVGAPLNSKVATSVAANSGQVSQQVSTPAPSVPALLASDNEAPADGINPAHGKAGHRCDIAVGAALPKS